MPALGDEFRSAREARGLSLSDVAEQLHIRSVYLAAIEDEDWKAIGAPVYVRGFMRTYARFLGLDAEAAVARFTTAAGAAPAASVRTEERASDRERDGRNPSIVSILAIVVAVAVVAYVGYAFIQYRSGSAPLARASASATAEPRADGSPSDASSPSDAASPGGAVAASEASPRARDHRLSVRLTEKSWLRVTIDGTVVAEGTYPAGTAKSFGGEKIADVRVGNAGGVQVAVNGRPVGSLGASGDVVERRFVLSGE